MQPCWKYLVNEYLYRNRVVWRVLHLNNKNGKISQGSSFPSTAFLDSGIQGLSERIENVLAYYIRLRSILKA